MFKMSIAVTLLIYFEPRLRVIVQVYSQLKCQKQCSYVSNAALACWPSANVFLLIIYSNIGEMKY